MKVTKYQVTDINKADKYLRECIESYIWDIVNRLSNGEGSYFKEKGIHFDNKELFNAFAKPLEKSFVEMLFLIIKKDDLIDFDLENSEAEAKEFIKKIIEDNKDAIEFEFEHIFKQTVFAYGLRMVDFYQTKIIKVLRKEAQKLAIEKRKEREKMKKIKAKVVD